MTDKNTSKRYFRIHVSEIGSIQMKITVNIMSDLQNNDNTGHSMAHVDQKKKKLPFSYIKLTCIPTTKLTTSYLLDP